MEARQLITLEKALTKLLPPVDSQQDLPEMKTNEACLSAKKIPRKTQRQMYGKEISQLSETGILNKLSK